MVAVKRLNVIDLTNVIDDVPVVESGDFGARVFHSPRHFMLLCHLFGGHGGDCFVDFSGESLAFRFTCIEIHLSSGGGCFFKAGIDWGFVWSKVH